MVTHGPCLLAPSAGLPSHQDTRSHGSVPQASPGECETPAVVIDYSLSRALPSLVSSLLLP